MRARTPKCVTAVRLKRCSLYLVPPNKIERPRTSSTFPMIDPVMEAFTTLVRPFDRAMPPMISSAAFPNVALSNPPSPSPTREASASVARPIQPATGTMPRAEQTKRAVGLIPPGQNRRRIAIGTKIRSQSSDGLSFKSLETSRLASANQPVRLQQFNHTIHNGPVRVQMNQEPRNAGAMTPGLSGRSIFYISCAAVAGVRRRRIIRRNCESLPSLFGGKLNLERLVGTA